MICEGLPYGPATRLPTCRNLLPGSRLRTPASFNYVDSQRWPPGFDTVAEWIEPVCRLDTLESGDVTSSEVPDGRRCQEAAMCETCEWSCVPGGADQGKGVILGVIRHPRPTVVVIVCVVV
jgi:hypothetical protein